MRKKLFIILVILYLSKDTSAKTKLRIVSLAPSITEILFALGLDEEIVGVSSFCNYPKEALKKEKVGSFSQPDIEKIIYLKPDLVFSTGLEQANISRIIKRLGLKVYTFEPSTMEELFSSIEEIGILTGKTKEAENLIYNMRHDIDLILKRTKEVPLYKKPKVFMVLWNHPLMTAGQGSFIDELIYLAGGINIAHNTKRPYSYFSFERLIKDDPECIIFASMYKDRDLLKKDPLWSVLKAVRSGRIYTDIKVDLILRPGPRLIEGLFEIYRRLYPEDDVF